MLDTHQFARGLASLSGLGRSSLKFGFAVTKVATYSGETLSRSDFKIRLFRRFAANRFYWLESVSSQVANSEQACFANWSIRAGGTAIAVCRDRSRNRSINDIPVPRLGGGTWGCLVVFVKIP